MKKLLIATTALTLLATPAHAQLLGGGGGLTGGLGSTLDLNSTISRTTDTLRSATRGAVTGDAATEGSQSVDRRSGRVEARRSANVNGAASVAQLADTPISAISGSANGSGNASGNGDAQAQLIGTDALGSAASNAVGRARDTAGNARNLVSPMINQASNAVPALPGSMPMASASASGEGSGEAQGSASLVSNPIPNTPIAPFAASASGNGNASGNGSASAQLIGTDAVSSLVTTAEGQAAGAAQLAGSAAGRLPSAPALPTATFTGEGSGEGQAVASFMSTPLAVAGSAAGAAQGMTAISPGMAVVSPEGLPMGEVKQIVADNRGEVQHVLVSNGNAQQLIPASDLAASGNALIAAQGMTTTSAQ